MNRDGYHESEAGVWLPVPAQVEEYSHETRVDPLHIFLGLMPTLVEKARRAEINAESHRNFSVTASGLMYDSTENRTGLITTANYKAKIADEDRHETDVEDIPKVCAEMDMINAAEELGFETLIGMVIAGTSNKQKILEVTGRPAATLVPCDDCRNLSEKSPLVHDKTFIITVGMTRNIWQFHTVGGLRRAYSKPAQAFKDSPVRIYSPLEWMHKQQDYTDRITARGLGRVIETADVARSRKHLEAAQKAIEF